METEKLQQQVASVERGMALLKREHLAMLTGLQLEITRLKRRCNELNCELDARFPQRTAAEECELASRRRASERLLEEQACAGASLGAALRARQVRAWALGRALEGDERRFLEELKRRSHRITALGRELHRQTLTSTTLGRELHRQTLTSTTLGRELHRQTLTSTTLGRQLHRQTLTSTTLGRQLHRQTLTSTTLGRQLHGACRHLQRPRLVEGEEGEEEEEEEEDQCSGGARPEASGRGGVPDEIEREEEWECDEEDDDEEDDGEEGTDRLWPPAYPGQSDELCARHVSARERRVRACVPCERVSSPQRPHPMPDPALFLVPLRYRLLRLKRPVRARGAPEGLHEEWEDVGEEGGVRRRVDMGAAEGETAL